MADPIDTGAPFGALLAALAPVFADSGPLPPTLAMVPKVGEPRHPGYPLADWWDTNVVRAGQERSTTDVVSGGVELLPADGSARYTANWWEWEYPFNPSATLLHIRATEQAELWRVERATNDTPVARRNARGWVAHRDASRDAATVELRTLAAHVNTYLGTEESEPTNTRKALSWH